jgi:hypothetical protein
MSGTNNSMQDQERSDSKILLLRLIVHCGVDCGRDRDHVQPLKFATWDRT